MKHLVAALLCMVFVLGSAVRSEAQSGYRVQPGDTLAVEVLEDPSLNRSVLVLPGGTVNFPFAGTVEVAGRSVLEVQQAITNAIAANFASEPTVFVSVNNVQLPGTATTGFDEGGINIFFVGEINSPGPKAIDPGTTFLQAMSLSGGFTNFAATKRIQLRRTGRDGRAQLYTIDYRALSLGGLQESNIILSDGDVILVPERRLFE